VSFKLRAEFRRGSGSEPSHVALDLSAPRVSETVEPPTVPAAVVPAPSAPAAAAPAEPEPRPTPAAPPIEVIRVPPRPVPPEPQATPSGSPAAPAGDAAPPVPRASEPGISAVRDVSLAAGVPDLAGGRRPVVPPLARMAAATGAVLVEFSVGTSGATHLGRVEGPELLREAAQQMVASWVFRRTSTERLFLTARVEFGQNEARATVAPAQ
jgi:outer membrane biosynthesis protein TonB